MRTSVLRSLVCALAAALLVGGLPAAETLGASGPASPATADAAAKKKKSKKKKAKCPARKRATKKKKRRSKRSVAESSQSKKKKATKKKSKKKSACPKKKKKKKAAGPNLEPRDYVKTANLSQPVHRDIETTSLMLPMADGVEVYLEIVRPKAPGRYGVILESSVYHGTLYNRTGARILPEPLGSDGNPVGLTGYFPPRGYAVVMMDLRGTGRSQGCLDHIGPNDRSDIKQVIEWAAGQSWSNGRVGILGHSYLGGTSIAAGSLGAKGLATIVPSAGVGGTMYHHQFQAGVPYNLQWAGTTIGYEPLALERHLPPGVPDPAFGGATGDNFGNDMQYFGCGLANASILEGEDQLSGRYSRWHAEREWSEGVIRSPVPVFNIHGLNDEAARVASIDWFTARNNRAGDKFWLGQWDHGIGCCPNRRSAAWNYALHAWFDKHLLERDVDTGPPLEVFLNDGPTVADALDGRKEIFTATGWPPSSQPLAFHASDDGGLARSAPAAGSVSFTGNLDGYNSNPGGDIGANFRTDRLDRDMLFVGVPEVQLASSQIFPRVHLIANLYDENADGQRRRLSQCAMNPELREGLDRVTPVIPGAEMKLKPPCYPMAHHLRRGHRLMLRVTTSDPEKVPLFPFDPNVTVYTGSDKTVVKLPLIESPKLYPDRFSLKFPK